ncbi:MAG: sigma 54-interacting transcriptional regulator [Thermodesulfobacteriota bacterium]|nr:sigma 54-interacting transcriptional regulator [Thermodesulfobacteriota bacterium]
MYLKPTALKDILIKDYPALSNSSTVAESLSLLVQNNLKAIPIIDKSSHIIGMITGPDILKFVAEGKDINHNISDDLLKEIFIANENSSIFDTWKSHTIISPIIGAVDSHNKFSGIITEGDLLNAYQKQLDFLLEELQLIHNSAYNGMIVVDKRGIIRMFNTIAETISGVMANEALGKEVEQIIPGLDLMKVIQLQKPEINQKLKIGTYSILLNKTPIIYNGEVLGAIGVFQDLTQLESTFKELNDLKAVTKTLEMIFESALEAIVVVDKNCNILYCNQKYADFLKTPKSEVIGKPITRLARKSKLNQTISTGIAEIGKTLKVNNNKTLVVNRIPLKDNYGKIIGAVGVTIFKDIDELKDIAQKFKLLETRVKLYKKELENIRSTKFTFRNFIGKSRVIKEIKKTAIIASKTALPVLIIGETGTGKELLAHAIHQYSPRKEKDFIGINCAAIPKELLESELFGYEKGAFTGARSKGKPGKFELADKGTLFLDEIGDMPLEMQAKLLRVLQEREIERVGGIKPIEVDFRLIAATNQDIEDMVKIGKFRGDLFYRLNAIKINLPPLRERREDIGVSINHFLKNKSKETGKIEITHEAANLLTNYNWPGNVRELNNVLETTLNFIENNRIDIKHLPSYITNLTRKSGIISPSNIKSLSDLEKEAILKTIKFTKGNMAKSSKLLGIHRTVLYKKLKKYEFNILLDSIRRE